MSLTLDVIAPASIARGDRFFVALRIAARARTRIAGGRIALVEHREIGTVIRTQVQLADTTFQAGAVVAMHAELVCPNDNRWAFEVGALEVQVDLDIPWKLDVHARCPIALAERQIAAVAPWIHVRDVAGGLVAENTACRATVEHEQSNLVVRFALARPHDVTELVIAELVARVANAQLVAANDRELVVQLDAWRLAPEEFATFRAAIATTAAAIAREAPPLPPDAPAGPYR